MVSVVAFIGEVMNSRHDAQNPDKGLAAVLRRIEPIALPAGPGKQQLFVGAYG